MSFTAEWWLSWADLSTSLWKSSLKVKTCAVPQAKTLCFPSLPQPQQNRGKEAAACQALQEASSLFLHNHLYSELYEKFIKGKEQKVMVTMQPNSEMQCGT